MKHRLDGRSYHERIGKPYYGHGLRSVMSPKPRPSIIERLTDWWLYMTPREALFLTVVILIAVMCAAWIVL